MNLRGRVNEVWKNGKHWDGAAILILLVFSRLFQEILQLE